MTNRVLDEVEGFLAVGDDIFHDLADWLGEVERCIPNELLNFPVDTRWCLRRVTEVTF